VATANLSTSTEDNAGASCATAAYPGTKANTRTSSLPDTGAATIHTCTGCDDLSYPGAGDPGRANTDATCTACHTRTARHFRPGTRPSG